uniref:Uncharacterized protein n=1 Tax=Rhodotorula taiwanensis RS1 TaxID=1246992 RepID=R4Z8J9_9BASI|nr:hypothetical protein RHTARS1M_11 [Rhodotorula taiwanensis RS1]
MGQSAFYVTIIALTGPSPWEWRWMETLFIFLFSTTLNSARISGSNIGVQQRAMNAASLDLRPYATYLVHLMLVLIIFTLVKYIAQKFVMPLVLRMVLRWTYLSFTQINLVLY